MSEAKKLIVISREFECDFKKLKEILDACPELKTLKDESEVNGYVQYKSGTKKTNNTITVLQTWNSENVKKVASDSNIIIHKEESFTVEQLDGYAYIKITKSIDVKYAKGTEGIITPVDFLKYLFQALSDLCSVGLMQGFERIIKKGRGTGMQEVNGDDKDGEHRIVDKSEESLQDQKYIICDYGDAETGKSTTLKKVIALLVSSKKTIPIGPIEYIPDGNNSHGMDEYAKFEVKGVKIAVCTQGDPKSDQLKYLQKAVNWGAHVIVCAARDDRNGVANARTVDNIYDGTSNYIIIWTRNFFLSKGDKGNGNNIIEDIMARDSADGIIRLIEQLTGVTI